MKILTRYILREHIAPFVFALLTITFLLIIDYVPKIIDQVIDKDLGLGIVLELIGLNLAWMVALSVPMAVLVATLMAFGRLSSDFEIIAIKESGINPLHVIIPVLVAVSVIAFGMVQFNDKILPNLNMRARTLGGDIRSMRPTLVLESGIFITDIPGYLVLIDDIDHTTSYVEGVRITESKQPNEPRLIIASNGHLKMTDNGQTMRFSLNDGEIHTLDLNDPDKYQKVKFDNQVINVPVSGSQLVRTSSDYRSDREMNIRQMEERVTQAANTIMPVRQNIRKFVQEKMKYLAAEEFVADFPETTAVRAALSKVGADASALVRHVERSRQQIASQQRIMDKYSIEIYKKYSIPGACLAFVLIGAPLGMMTRKGGMGAAIAIAILLFIVYWAFLIGGEGMADRGVIPPFWAMWSANILIGVLGLYFCYSVVTEKPLLGWFRKGLE